MATDQNPFKSERGPSGAATRPYATVALGFQRVPEQEKVRRVLGHFEAVARRYDMMNTLLSLGLHRVWKRTAVKALGPRPGERVLDLCGGTGDLALRCAKDMGANGKVVVYDLSRAMMKAGMRKGGRSSRYTLHRVQGDAECTAFRAGVFDRVIVGFGIRNLTHPQRGFMEAHRILRPGGKIVCLEFATPGAPVFRRLYDLYSFRVMPLIGRILAGSREAYAYLAESIRVFSSPDEISAMMREAGFSRVRYRRLTQGIAVVHEGVKGRWSPDFRSDKPMPI